MMMESVTEKKSVKIRGKNGGARPNAGRKAGSPNKITAEIKAIAQEHGQKAIELLVDMMYSAQSDSTKVMAAKELLDRGYGKATQYNEVTGNMSLTVLTGLPINNDKPSN
jgi:hypothetical protein